MNRLSLFGRKSGVALRRINGVVLSKPMRFITTDSWAREILEGKAETLDQITLPDIVITEELLYNPSDKVKAIGDKVLQMNMIEMRTFIIEMERRLGPRFGAGALGGGGRSSRSGSEAAAVAAPEPVKVKEIFDLKLTSFDAKAKIKIIKEIRTITGLGLKEAKELVEGVPAVVKTGLKKDEADALVKLLTEAGGVVELA